MSHILNYTALAGVAQIVSLRHISEVDGKSDYSHIVAPPRFSVVLALARILVKKGKKMIETKRRTKAHTASDADVDVVVLGVGTCGEALSLRLLGAGAFTRARDS
jgi:hypothetical protein